MFERNCWQLNKDHRFFKYLSIVAGGIDFYSQAYDRCAYHVDDRAQVLFEVFHFHAVEFFDIKIEVDHKGVLRFLD